MPEVALVFNGPLIAPATTRLRNAICAIANGGNTNNQIPSKFWLLISSSGGNVEEGFALYNLLRVLKCEVVTVNMGQIASTANVVFLAGNYRIACPESYFHFHDFDWTFPAAHTMTRDNLADISQLLEIGRTNKKAVFKSRTQLTDADFEALQFLDHPMIKNATFAKDKGIIHEISLPNLPAGTPILNVDY
jgi:ATP-dependent protease ClpP protease subunit